MNLIPSSGTSFTRKTKAIFALLVVIPGLLLTYMSVQQFSDRNIFFFAIVCAFVSIAIGFLLIRKSAYGLNDLSEETRSLASGSRREPICFNGDQELNDIADNFNHLYRELEKSRRDFKGLTTQLMVYARDLDSHQQTIVEEAELRTKLGCYVGKNVVDQLSSDREGLLKNEKRELTILFSDIRSFTTMAEHMDAEAVLTMLNEYFDVMVEIIFRHNGVLDKFVGDELMALFGLLQSPNTAAVDATRAALEMQAAVSDMMQERNEQGKQVFEIGIGINTGEVIVGNVGAKNRMDYTVIGDTVNVAARFEQLAQGHEIVIGEQSWQACQGAFKVRKKGEITVKNRVRPINCYEVLR